MFETFFGLQQTPFGRQIATANLYASAQFQELLARLQYMAQKRLLGLVTGEIGAGKSTALRALRDHLDPAHFRWLYLSDSSFTPRTFYRELSVQLDREPRFITAEAKRVFQTAVLDLYQNQQKTPVLVVDEAHLLSGLMLEEIRFLTNFAMDSLSPMALILVGQPELRRTLALQAFEPIQQRVNLRFHLGGFTAEETHSYVKHQLDVAGCHRDLFTREALQVIYQFTRGIARRINNVCTSCLLDAFTRNESVIDDRLVRRVLEAEFRTH